ncbi:hypothetical protein [Methylobacterium brachiatum]
MSTRLERLEAALAQAAGAVGLSRRRLRQASADRLARALAAPSQREKLAALEDPILTRADRRRLREQIGVSLAPETRSGPVGRRRGMISRIQVALSRRRLNPFTVVIGALVAAPIVTASGLALIHTGQGARLNRTCTDVVLTRPDGTTRTLTLSRGDWVVVHGHSRTGVRITMWAPLIGYDTATVSQTCLDDAR